MGQHRSHHNLDSCSSPVNLSIYRRQSGSCSGHYLHACASLMSSRNVATCWLYPEQPLHVGCRDHLGKAVEFGPGRAKLGEPPRGSMSQDATCGSKRAAKASLKNQTRRFSFESCGSQRPGPGFAQLHPCSRGPGAHERHNALQIWKRSYTLTGSKFLVFPVVTRLD